MSISGVYFFVMGAVELIPGGRASTSFTARFDPQTAFAQTALTLASPDPQGYVGIGITHYETRPDPNGPNQPTDFSHDPVVGYPPCVFAEQMTVVTGELDADGLSQAAGQMTVFLFD